MGKLCGPGGVYWGAEDPTALRVWGFCICKCMKIPVSETCKTDSNSVEVIIRVCSYPNMTRIHAFFVCDEQRSNIASDVCVSVI